MKKHYNAFISYRHAPLDSKIAAHIQHALERFTIPPKVRKETGVKRIERVFRDKEELPLTNDLTATITEALENADFLIVICSHQLKESEWCQREIETFIKMHGRQNILTVLAEGEPSEVVPEILCREEKIIVDDEGNETTQIVDVEALSCDFRMPLKEADKIELPRLAAALIGCPYDDLIRRMQHYRMKRMTIVFSAILAVAIAFGAYLFYSMNRFKNDYEEALRKESVILAAQSASELENYNRIEAINLALQALPSEGNDRPVVPDAIEALSDAVLAYEADNNINMHPVWNYSEGTRLADFMLSPEGKTLCAISSTDSVFVWDIETHEKIFSISSSYESVLQIIYCDEDTLAISYLGDANSAVRAYDIRTSEMLWESTSYYPSVAGLSLYSRNQLKLFDNDRIAISNSTDNSISIVNSKTGNQESIIQCQASSYSSYPIRNYTFSEDLTKIAVVFASSITDDYCVVVLDTNTSEEICSLALTGDYADITWINSDKIAVALYENSDYYMKNDRVYFGPDTCQIVCLDASNADVVWEQEFSYTSYKYNHGFAITHNGTAISYYAGNMATSYDVNTGEVIYIQDATDSILDVDFDVNDNQLCMTVNGLHVIPVETLGDGGVSSAHFFQENLIQAHHLNNAHWFTLAENGNEIIQYSTHVFDENFTVANIVGDNTEIIIGTTTSIEPTRNKLIYEDYLISISQDSNYERYLNIYDITTNRLILSYQLPFDSYELVDSDGEYIYLTYLSGYPDSSVLHLIRFPFVKHRSSNVSYDDIVIGAAELIEVNKFTNYSDGVITFWQRESDGYLVLKAYNIFENRGNSYRVEGTSLANIPQPIYIPQMEMFLYNSDIYTLHFLDKNTEEVMDLPLPDNWGELITYAYSESYQRLIITDGINNLVFDDKGNFIQSFDVNGKVVGLLFNDSYLIVVTEDGYLYQYSASDLELINTCTLRYNISYVTGDRYVDIVDQLNLELLLDNNNNLLYIMIYNDLDIIDLENWHQIGTVPNTIAVSTEYNRFFVRSGANPALDTYGYYDRYSLEDLIAMAHEILGDTEEITSDN